MSQEVDPLYEKIEQVRLGTHKREARIIPDEIKGRYPRNAYYFALDLVDYTIGAVGKEHAEGDAKHVGCHELMAHAPLLAEEQFGRGASLVFMQWKMPTMGHLGSVIYDLIDGELLSRLGNESERQFQTGQNIVKNSDATQEVREGARNEITVGTSLWASAASKLLCAVTEVRIRIVDALCLILSKLADRFSQSRQSSRSMEGQ